MSTSETPVTALETGSARSRADIVWIVVCFAICGGLFVYLFTPYLMPALKNSSSITGVVGAVVFAVLGFLLDMVFQRRAR